MEIYILYSQCMERSCVKFSMESINQTCGRRFEDIIADTLSQVSPLAEDLIDIFFGHCPEQ
jgi:hypothetical protein